MADAPLFSVIIPVHDRAASIRATLDSVACQTCPDFECIVVDDGSADFAALQTMVEGMNDARFRYVRRINGGGGAARNTGIAAASGQYIAFLDSDDRFLPEKLQACRKYLGSNDAVALYSQVLVDRGVGKCWVRPDRAIGKTEDVGEYLFVANQFIQTSSIVIAREAAAATLFDPNLRKGQDLDFCIRLQRDGVRFTMLPQPLVIWVDIHEHSRTSRTPGFQAPLAWLEASRELLTKRAYLGYRATILAYYMARSRPFRSALDLIRAMVEAGVHPKIVARNAIRAYLPRSLYRRLVNTFVAHAGRELSVEIG